MPVRQSTHHKQHTKHLTTPAQTRAPANYQVVYNNQKTQASSYSLQAGQSHVDTSSTRLQPHISQVRRKTHQHGCRAVRCSTCTTACCCSSMPPRLVLQWAGISPGYGKATNTTVMHELLPSHWEITTQAKKSRDKPPP